MLTPPIPPTLSSISPASSLRNSAGDEDITQSTGGCHRASPVLCKIVSNSIQGRLYTIVRDSSSGRTRTWTAGCHCQRFQPVPLSPPTFLQIPLYRELTWHTPYRSPGRLVRFELTYRIQLRNLETGSWTQGLASAGFNRYLRVPPHLLQIPLYGGLMWHRRTVRSGVL
jgi:hypothetical protein